MPTIKIIPSERPKTSRFYYKDTFLGFVEDGGHIQMTFLMNKALELQAEEEKAKQVKCIVAVARSVYRLDKDEVSESRMVEIVKENFA